MTKGFWMPRGLANFLAGFLVIAALTACDMSPAERAITLCDTYQTTLRTLAGFRTAGELSDGQIATVDRLRPRANAICSGEIPTTEAMLGELDAVLLEFITIKQEVTP